MAALVEDKNQYTFIWHLENINFFKVFHCIKEIRSPLFVTENLGQTSWFLSIQNDSDWAKANHRFPCFLLRFSKDEGIRAVGIKFQLRVTSVDNECLSVNRRDASHANAIRKGSSFIGCELDNTSNLNFSREVKIILQCQMTETFSVEKPILESSIVRTKAYPFTWDWSLSEQLLSGLCYIEYNAFFVISEGFLSIRIRRSDLNSLIKCNMMCGFRVIHSGMVDEIQTREDVLIKTFKVNDTLDFPTTLETDDLSDSKFIESVTIDGVILTSIVTDIQNSTFKGKFDKINSAHKLDTADILRKDQLRMYENSVHSDVKLQIRNELFPAHKGVLASRSPVFSAMFDQDMVENQTGIVNITDLDADTLNLLLKYMYATVVEDLDYESALKLLIAADNYQILSLKKICANFLFNALTEQNVCEVLIVSDMVSQNELKRSAMDYVKAHASEVLSSDNWKELAKSNAILVSEILIMISEAYRALKLK